MSTGTPPEEELIKLIEAEQAENWERLKACNFDVDKYIQYQEKANNIFAPFSSSDENRTNNNHAKGHFRSKLYPVN